MEKRREGQDVFGMMTKAYQSFSQQKSYSPETHAKKVIGWQQTKYLVDGSAIPLSKSQFSMCSLMMMAGNLGLKVQGPMQQQNVSQASGMKNISQPELRCSILMSRLSVSSFWKQHLSEPHPARIRIVGRRIKLSAFAR